MQLLTPEQESTLVDWARHQAEMGLPYSRKALMAQASAISGKTITGRVYLYKKFARRHPELCASKSVQLNPKRASNFNRTVINEH
jgi:hypothetical protein